MPGIRLQRRQRQRFSLKTGLYIGTACTAIAIIYIFLFGAGIFKAEKSLASQTYTTIGSGNWTNSSNIWSTDGITNCNCTPSTTVNSTIIINHNINLNTDLLIASGGNITITNGGKLNSSREINVNAGLFNSFGQLNVKDLIIAQNGVLKLYSPSTISSKLTIDGTLELNAELTLNNGLAEINNTGILMGNGAWELISGNGNLVNRGIIDLTNGCITLNNGNFTNNAGAMVVGTTGFINTKTGNLVNNGTFSQAVSWCSAGIATGLVAPANCSGCRSGILPISLIDFVGNYNNNNIDLSWTSATEKNNDYYTIEKSFDGKTYTELAKIKGAGNSNTNSNYNYTDYYEGGENIYYSLWQTDFDGTTTKLKTIVIKLSHSNKNSTVKISPNPVSDYFSAQFIAGEAEKIKVQIISLKGELIFTDNFISMKGNNLYHFKRNSNLESGTYLLRLLSENEVIGQTKIVCI